MDQGTALFRKYLDGDERALDQIFSLYHPPLIMFINRYVRDLNTAEDLAADTFAQLIVNPKKFNFSVSLKTYLFLIGKSRALDHLRAQKKMREREIPLPTADDPETLIIYEEEKQELYDAMERLSDDYRNALYLVYFEELSYKEAGIVMKKSAKQIENLVYRAKIALRERLCENEKQVKL